MAILTSATTPATGTEAIFDLIDILCLAGWEIPQWSDGSTLTTPGSPLTANPYGSAASGAGNLGNTGAWFRITAPDGSREWMFQRNSTDKSWKTYRSRLGFSGGSPSATTLPTDAVSGQLIWNADTWYLPPGRWLVEAEDSAPYGFTGFTVVIGGGNVRTVLFDEPLVSGSYPAADLDPVLSGVYYNSSGFGPYDFYIFPGGVPVGYKRFLHGDVSASNARFSYFFQRSPDGSRVAPAENTVFAQMSPSPYNNSEIPVPIFVATNAPAATNTGWIGVTRTHRWTTVGGRSNGQTLYDSTNNKYWIYCGGLWVQWDNTTPTI